jgi:glycosyltransferase involved in cell wall biosynthesis
MKLSIIVVAYNVAPYLEQCLRSCVFDALDDYEVIVVVNKSDDGTKEIARRIAAESPRRFRVMVFPENIGLGPARNAGLQEAHGDYVAFLDGDDWYADGAGAIFAELFRSPDFSVCVFNHDRVFEDGRVKANAAFAKLVTGSADTISDRRRLLRNLGTAWNKVLRRDFLLTNRLFFPAGFYEDIDWNFKVLILCDRIFVQSKVVVHYRRREGSISNSTDSRHFEIFARYDALSEFLAVEPEIASRYGLVIYEYCGRQLTKVVSEGRLPCGSEERFMKMAYAEMRRLRSTFGGMPDLRVWLQLWRELSFGYLKPSAWKMLHNLRRSI